MTHQPGSLGMSASMGPFSLYSKGGLSLQFPAATQEKGLLARMSTGLSQVQESCSVCSLCFGK